MSLTIGPLTNFGLLSFQWCVLFLCLAKLYRSCPSHDKDLLQYFFLQLNKFDYVSQGKCAPFYLASKPGQSDATWYVNMEYLHVSN